MAMNNVIAALMLAGLSHLAVGSDEACQASSLGQCESNSAQADEVSEVLPDALSALQVGAAAQRKIQVTSRHDFQTKEKQLASCDASTAPDNGDVGDCDDDLASGSTCQPTCDSGYTISGSSSCTDGVLTAATCGAPVVIAATMKCNPNTYISSADRDCESTVCTPSECADYVKANSNCSSLYFNFGTGGDGACGCITDLDKDCSDSLNWGTGNENFSRDLYAVRSWSCDASTAPDNGDVGDCDDELASGSTCQPTCDSGYTVSGSSSCLNGALTPATCGAPFVLVYGLKCKPNDWEISTRNTSAIYDANYAAAADKPLYCAAYIKNNSDRCNQNYFNLAQSSNNGCGCIQDLTVDCSDTSNQDEGLDQFDRDIYQMHPWV